MSAASQYLQRAIREFENRGITQDVEIAVAISTMLLYSDEWKDIDRLFDTLSAQTMAPVGRLTRDGGLPGVAIRGAQAFEMEAHVKQLRQRRPSSVAAVSETGHYVIINHAYALHEGIADGWPDKGEACFFQSFGHGFSFG